jgi:WD40 repeat protein
VLQTVFLPDSQIAVLAATPYSFSLEPNPYSVDIVSPTGEHQRQVDLSLPLNAYETDVSLSPNARWATLAYGSPVGQGGAQFWDLARPDSSLKLLASGAEAAMASMSHSGDIVAMVDDRAVYLSRMDSANPDGLLTSKSFALDFRFAKATLPGRSGRAVQFSDDDQRLAVLTTGNIRIYDPNSGAIVDGIPLEGETVLGFLFSPDRKYVIYAVERRGITRLLRWPLETVKPEGYKAPEIYRSGSANITSMEIGTGGRLVIGDETGYVRGWEQSGDSQFLLVRAHSASVVNLLVSPDGQLILSAGEADGTRLWQTVGARGVVSSSRVFNDVSSVTRSNDGDDLVIGGINQESGSGDIRVYPDLQTPDELTDIPFASDGGSSLGPIAVSSNWIAAARTVSYQEIPYSLDIWKRNAEGTSSSSIAFPLATRISSLAFDQEGQRLAIATSSGKLWIVATADLEKSMVSSSTTSGGSAPLTNTPGPQLPIQQDLPSNLANVQNLLFTADSKYLIAGSASGLTMVELEDLATGSLPHAWFPIGISPDQKWLVTAGVGNTVQLFDLADITSPATVLGVDNGTITQIAFSLDSERLAVATKKGKISVFDLTSSAKLSSTVSRPAGSAAEITSLAFSTDESPGGEWLLAGSVNGSLYLWNSNRLGDKPIVVASYKGRIVYAGFTVDGQWIVTVVGDQTLRRLSMDPEKVWRAACQLAGRNLKRTEWQSYFDADYTEEYADTCGPEFGYGLEQQIAAQSLPTPTTGPTAEFSTPQPATATVAPSCTSYTVQAGDSLALIASKVGIDIKFIIADNQIENPNFINVGQTLKIRQTNAPCPP